MNFSFTHLSVPALILGTTLLGCGGGNTAGPSNTEPLVIDHKTPTRETVLSGHTDYVTVTQQGSKTCNGTGSVIQSPANPAQFNVTSSKQISALTYNTTHSWRWNNCAPLNSQISTVTHINATDLSPLALSSEGRYSVFSIPQIFPEKIKAGDTGSYGPVTVFADDTETVAIGYANSVFSVETDKYADSLIKTSVINFYDSNGVLLETGIQKRRLSSVGQFDFISDELRFPLTGDVISFNAI